MERSGLKEDLVLDSSVIIKWFCEEENTNIALGIREDFTKGTKTITTPDLSMYEIANALRYNKNITKEEIEEAVNSLIDLGIDIIVPTKNIMKSAIDIAFDSDITVYDAYFVALAKELGFTLVTADGSLFEKIKKLKFAILLKDMAYYNDSTNEEIRKNKPKGEKGREV